MPAARAANGGALPPDQSLLVKARENGPDYIHALMLGYVDPPAGTKVPEGQYYNEYFPGHFLAMPPPLHDGQVEYSDGTQATVDQMAKDVVQFLTWASEPTMEQRKQMGIKAVRVPGAADRAHLHGEAEDLEGRALSARASL